MKVYLMLGSILLGLFIVFGIYRQGIESGYNKAQVELSSQVAEKEAEIESLKLKAAKQITKQQKRLQDQRRKANVQITKLLKTNKDLEAWWNAPVHPCAIAYIFRLSDKACKGLDKLPSRSNEEVGKNGNKTRTISQWGFSYFYANFT